MIIALIGDFGHPEKLNDAETHLTALGQEVYNLNLHSQLSYPNAQVHRNTDIDIAETVAVLDGWKNNFDARLSVHYAMDQRKEIVYQEDGSYEQFIAKLQEPSPVFSG